MEVEYEYREIFGAGARFHPVRPDLCAGEGNPQFTAEHVLKALLDDEQGMAASLIERAGGDAKIARLANDEAIDKLPKSSGGNGQL